MDEELPTFSAGQLIDNKWEIVQKIGAGAFGCVYIVEEKGIGDLRAMKVEMLSCQHPSLETESLVLSQLQGTRHSVKFYGSYIFEAYRYIILQLAGSNLSTLLHSVQSGKFTLSTTVRLAVQCIEAVRDVHNVGFVHRDIKPANFVIGNEQTDRRVLYLLDFGMARRYAASSGDILPERTECEFYGTVPYASPRVHEGKDYARHDDLFSVLYMCVELYFGKLPWQDLTDADEVGKIKSSISAVKLLRDLPKEFYEWHDTLTKMKFSEKPNYEWLIEKMRQIMTSRGYTDDAPYDWETVHAPSGGK